MSLSRKTRENIEQVLNAGKGAAGRKRGKVCHRTGGKRGKNVCPASAELLVEIVAKNVKPGILPGDARHESTKSLSGR